eukprot:10970140-Heterocapsa_arctica.AAC.1
MSYEFQVRKRAFDLVRDENFTLAQAFKDACASSEVEELHFTTPIALMQHKRPAPAPKGKGSWTIDQDWAKWPRKGDYEGEKGDYNGGPQGRPQGRRQGRHEGQE